MGTLATEYDTSYGADLIESASCARSIPQMHSALEAILYHADRGEPWANAALDRIKAALADERPAIVF